MFVVIPVARKLWRLIFARNAGITRPALNHDVDIGLRERQTGSVVFCAASLEEGCGRLGG